MRGFVRGRPGQGGQLGNEVQRRRAAPLEYNVCRNRTAAPNGNNSGIVLRYDDPHWVFNLSAEPNIAAGTYIITVMADDDSDYILDDYEVSWVRLQ